MKAKEFDILKWLTPEGSSPFDLNDGAIKFIHFFQMLCPGCVYYGIPETIKVYNRYQSDKLKVYGIHSVFEHHHVMTEEALRVFLEEWKIPFPVGIDRHVNGDWMPQTMRNFHLQGTPSTLIIDGEQNIRLLRFGHFGEEELFNILDSLL